MAKIRYKEALGLEVKRGRPAIAKKPERKELHRLYVKESKSIREVAETLRCSKDMVYRCLKKYGIAIRPGYNRSRLRKYNLSILQNGVKVKGIRVYAKELGVHENTLRHYLKRLKARG